MANYSPVDRAIKDERNKITSNTIVAVGSLAVGAGLVYTGLEVADPVETKAGLFAAATTTPFVARAFFKNALNAYHRMKFWQEER